MADVDTGIRANGSLGPGRYAYGEASVAGWTAEDWARVERWLADVAGIHVSNVQEMVVEDVGDRLVMDMVVMHRTPTGQAHLVGHCNDEPNTLVLRTTHNLYMADSMEVYCGGCKLVLGEVSRSVPRKDWTRLLENKHDDLCVSEIQVQYAKTD